LNNETYFEQHIITHIDNPSGRIKFKDTRKVSIGISKKDILSYRCKKKSAFYNCFVLILRLKVKDAFKEFHVKVFNTGKLEIPGVQCESVFEQILQQIIDTLQPCVETPLGYKDNSNETVLINSNFNCGYYINREILYEILKMKYNIQAIYDPCSYPGIQCKFYYNPDIGIQSGCQISEENKNLYKNIKEVSFMIFRTGSVLIVGRCDEEVLIIIYEFLKVILHDEYRNICQKNIKVSDDFNKDKKKKIRRKNILIEFSNLKIT
jgi:TATA-box binding protein (TBP) (component of TFIID and TFIIIB)